MPVTINTTQELIEVIASLDRPSTALLDRYYAQEVTFETEAVAIDIELGGNQVAPLVLPEVPAKRRTPDGFKTLLVKPAYVKDMSEFRPEGMLTRDLGERIGGEFSPEERSNRRLIRELERKIRSINGRLEVMAAEALRTGKVTLADKDYPSTTIDFLRDAALTPTALATSARWTESTSTPLDDLQDWAVLVEDKSGVSAIDVIMGTSAWKSFRNHAKVEKKLDLRNARGAQMDLGAVIQRGLTFRGTIDGFNIFTYSGSYTDPADGQAKKIWPANWVGVTAPGEEGVNGLRLFGAIVDYDAGITPIAYFPKMWIEKNPSAMMLLVQSGPLMAPGRPNGSLGVQVQDA